ncbi:MAG: hypothetical protein ACX93N_00955 [Pseudohaliea sp.]
MNRTEAELIYRAMKGTDDLVKEMESLRPSDNPAGTILGYALTVAIFVWVQKVSSFSSSPENVAVLLLGFVLVNQIAVTEINRRTHKRIDVLYKLMNKRTARQDA